MSTAAQLRIACDRKAWATLVARAALRGYQLWRTDAADGVVRYLNRPGFRGGCLV